MKKLIVLLLVLGLSGSLFASLQKNATAGTITNILDDISDPLYINGAEQNVINFGTRSLANWLNSSSANFLFNLGLVELPGSIRVGIIFNNTENWTDPADVNLQTNITISGVADSIVTTAITWRKSVTESSSRDMTFVLSPGNRDISMGLSYRYQQSGTATWGSFTIVGSSMGAIADNTITEIFSTNTGKVYSRTTTLLGNKGYDDSLTTINTFTPALKLGDLSIYVPVIITSFGTAQKALKTNISETPTNAVTEISHSYESYEKNGKTTLIQLKPSLVVPMNNFLSNLVATVSVNVGFGFAPVSNTVYSLISVTGKNTAITNATTTRNTTAWDNYGYTPLGIGGELSWKKKINDKIEIAVKFKADYNIILNGYKETVSNYTIVNTNNVYSYKTTSLQVSTISSSSSSLITSLPFGIKWQALDWLSVNLGTKLTYTNTSYSSKVIKSTPSYFSDNGGTTNISLVSSGLSPYDTVTASDSGSSSTSMVFSSGFSWKLDDQFYVDGLLTGAVADNTLIGGANRFLFGAFFDQFTSTANWSLEARLLF